MVRDTVYLNGYRWKIGRCRYYLDVPVSGDHGFLNLSSGDRRVPGKALVQLDDFFRRGMSNPIARPVTGGSALMMLVDLVFETGGTIRFRCNLVEFGPRYAGSRSMPKAGVDESGSLRP